MRTEEVGLDVLLAGFPERETLRLTQALAEADLRARSVRDAHQAAAILGKSAVRLVLLDLSRPFGEVLGVLETARTGRRQGCPILGVGRAPAGAAVCRALRGLGLDGLIPPSPTPQHLVFRVNRVLHGGRHDAARVSPRVPVNLPAALYGAGTLIRGRALNLSETGLFVASTEVMPNEQRVVVRLPLEADLPPLTAVCRVVWTNASGAGRRYFKGMGLHFVEMAPDARARLAAFLGRALRSLDLETLGPSQSPLRLVASGGRAGSEPRHPAPAERPAVERRGAQA